MLGRAVDASWIKFGLLLMCAGATKGTKPYMQV